MLPCEVCIIVEGRGVFLAKNDLLYIHFNFYTIHAVKYLISRPKTRGQNLTRFWQGRIWDWEWPFYDLTLKMWEHKGKINKWSFLFLKNRFCWLRKIRPSILGGEINKLAACMVWLVAVYKKAGRFSSEKHLLSQQDAYPLTALDLRMSSVQSWGVWGNCCENTIWNETVSPTHTPICKGIIIINFFITGCEWD